VHHVAPVPIKPCVRSAALSEGDDAGTVLSFHFAVMPPRKARPAGGVLKLSVFPALLNHLLKQRP
jgi:hypothetical protein